MLIAGEHAVGQAVILVESRDHAEDGGAPRAIPRDKRPYGGGLDGLGIIDAVRGKR